MKTKIRHIGIIGGGKMGTSIFNRLSQSNEPITWYIRNDNERPNKKYKRKLNRALEHGLINQSDFNTRNNNHIITNNINTLATCDLVIESINENLEAKKGVVNQLFKILNEDAIIATNSSSFLPWQLTTNNQLSKRIIGLHFFYPTEFKNIAEVIGKKDANSHLEKTRQFLMERGFQALFQNENNAFLLNRLMLNLQLKAFVLSQKSGYSFQEIDAAVDKYLFPEGIFRMMDEIGLDILQKSIKNYNCFEDNFEQINLLQHFLDEKVTEGEIGTKTSMGFYNYLTPKKDQIYSDDRLKSIARLLLTTYQSAFNFYVEKKYCQTHELVAAMDAYLDTDTKEWEKIIAE